MGNEFDADKILEALEAPKVTIRGREYEGRKPSVIEVVRFQQQVTKIKWEDNPDAWEEFFDKAASVTGIPAEVLTSLPVEAAQQVIGFFLGSQAQMGPVSLPTSNAGSENSDSDEASP